MYHRILIVAAAEGFIVKGIETKLQGIGQTPVYTSFQMKDHEGSCTNTDIIIIFTDDSIGSRAEGLLYIKDQCQKNNVQIAVIATKEEYEVLNGYIPEELIYKLYERPLNMEELIGDMSKLSDVGAKTQGRKTILIVDDDVSYMTMISEWLKDKYQISMANSGMQAITWLEKNHADLILLDYEMPIKSGPQVLEMIRSDASIARTPVMFLTGVDDKDNIMKVLSLKPVGYQLKSVEKNKLRENIANFFASKKK